MRIETELDGAVVGAIERHYRNAKEKHPYFCDRITCLSEAGAEMHLSIHRHSLEVEEKAGDVEVNTLLFCEFYEAMQAYTHGDTAAAVEECYDAIAVLLRVVDVLEERQALGRPKKGEVAHG
jgi:hypothetical protein